MRLDRNSSGDKWRVRPDGGEKVTGTLKYLTDLRFPDMLYGKILRTAYPHARILSIDTSTALAYPGVMAVLTWEDVPGLNRFGISFPDQPVFCEDLVRYEGDAIAALAAVSKEVAEAAVKLIRVEYEVLPILDSPHKAMAPSAPRLHPNGNLLHQTHVKRGDAEEAFAQCTVVVEETYVTPRQMHTYMETEGGVFVPQGERGLTVYCATQHGYKDRMQLARILSIPESHIRVVSSPIGGSFGGKDELNVQPYGALLALRCGKPVKMHNSRMESVKAGLKRHPMEIKMKTGIDENGKLLAHQVSILSDTGAYATLGGPVLNFATEHAIGPYRIPHVEIAGKAVYTNNGVSGEFRGFGGNQVIFALEGQLDRLAEAIEMDPWELRKRNMRDERDPGPLGQRIVPTDGARQVWEAVLKSPLWAKRGAVQKGKEPWIRRGIGASLAMHGSGLGFGIPDPAGGRISLNREGKIEVAFGHEEFGQGLLSTLQILLQDHFRCDSDDLHIVLGDTDRVPASGSSTASRTTSMVWHALNRLKPPFLQALLARASKLSGMPTERLFTGTGGIWYRKEGEPEQTERIFTYRQLAEMGTEGLMFQTQFHFPVTPDAVMGAHFLYTYLAVVTEVEVDLLTGRVKVLDIDQAVAAGPVVNPMGYLGQIEGGNVMALGFTLTEDALMEEGRYLTKNLDTYLIPTIHDVPEQIRVEALEELPVEDVYGPRGVGEVGTVALAPAVVSAIYHATGKWVSKLPVSPEQLVEGGFL